MRYEVNRNTTELDMGDEILLVNEEEKVVTLTSTSRFIYELVRNGSDIDGIFQEIKRLFDVKVEDKELKNDILECIDILVANKFLVTKE